jgi:hypothetical protein
MSKLLNFWIQFKNLINSSRDESVFQKFERRKRILNQHSDAKNPWVWTSYAWFYDDAINEHNQLIINEYEDNK